MAEVIGLCHRVIVMRSGRIMGELTGAEIDEHEIVRLAMGLDDVGTRLATHQAVESEQHGTI